MKPTQIDKIKQVPLAPVGSLGAGEEPTNECTDGDYNNGGQEVGLAKLYQAAKDENELLEFKNYELLFKIQELEQNQRNILSKLVINDNKETDTGQPEELVAASSLKQTANKSKLENKRFKVGFRQPIKLMSELDELSYHEDRYQEEEVSKSGLHLVCLFLKKKETLSPASSISYSPSRWLN